MKWFDEEQVKCWGAFFNGVTMKQCYDFLKKNELPVEGVIACKRRIRGIRDYGTDGVPDENRVVKDYGMDGCLVRRVLKAGSMEQAEDEFRSEHYIEYYDMGFDCSGQMFTAWHSIFEVGGRYVLYHRVSCDC